MPCQPCQVPPLPSLLRHFLKKKRSPVEYDDTGYPKKREKKKRAQNDSGNTNMNMEPAHLQQVRTRATQQCSIEQQRPIRRSWCQEASRPYSIHVQVHPLSNECSHDPPIRLEKNGASLLRNIIYFPMLNTPLSIEPNRETNSCVGWCRSCFSPLHCIGPDTAIPHQLALDFR